MAVSDLDPGASEFGRARARARAGTTYQAGLAVW
jgi:hypothetical protein